MKNGDIVIPEGLISFEGTDLCYLQMRRYGGDAVVDVQRIKPVELPDGRRELHITLR